MKTLQEDVAIYWGAFNPPTLAHEQVVKEVLSTQEISKIIISPSGERKDKDFWISWEQRKKLIDTYMEILSWEWLNVELDTHYFEWKNGSHTTTASEEKYFWDKLWISPWFIFGSDVAKDMPDWLENEWKFIEKKLNKIFIPRPGSQFDFSASWYENYILLDEVEMLDVSSSIAREIVKNKCSISWILNPKIAETISENNIIYN